MQIKRYEAASMREAMAMIKADLGSEAIVLSTKSLPPEQGGTVEVLAARDVHNGSGGATPGGYPDRRVYNEGAGIKSPPVEESALPAGQENMKLKMLMEQKADCDHLLSEMADIRGMMESFFDLVGSRKRTDGMGHMPKVYRYLTARGISRPAASILVERLKQEYQGCDIQSYDKSLQSVEDLIRQSITACSGQAKSGRIKVFVGPTGVGKTTTLAKLAAYYTMERKMKTGLISTDNFRIAAVEQLRVYSRIMNIPLEIATDGESFRKALESYAGMDVVLVDTPGRSRTDRQAMEKLNETLHAGCPVEMNLLLSMTSSVENMVDVANSYKMFNYDNIIITKVDECNRFGSVFEVLDRIHKPIVYLTNGQNVPHDIRKATPGILTKMILGHRLQ